MMDKPQYTYGAKYICLHYPKGPGAEYNPIAQCIAGEYDTPEWEEHASLLVKAANAYDANQARIAELELALKVARALMLQEADLASRAGQMDRLEAGATRITAALEPKP